MSDILAGIAAAFALLVTWVVLTALSVGVPVVVIVLILRALGVL